MKRSVTIYHSPDSDDAFMFYGFSAGKIRVPGYEFTHELCDIQTLNENALKGILDVTAISVHAYPFLNDQYVILNCGASMGGKNHGPLLIAKGDLNLADGRIRKIALPGKFTSAALAAKIYFLQRGFEAEFINARFDLIQDLIKKNEVDAGVIIHEGQITCKNEGFTEIVNFGRWWWEDTGLPLPLGVNAALKDLRSEGLTAVHTALLESIKYSLEHRQEALRYALHYGRGITLDEADRFVEMYVNDITLDLGDDGRRSIKRFLEAGSENGLIDGDIHLEFFPSADSCQAV